jgi:hypothetical protein
MDNICITLPLVTGKTADARTFLQQLDTTRRVEFDQSEQKIGITKELWFLAALPSGDHLIGYMESADFNGALSSFVASRDPFDLWFKEQMFAVTGVDVNHEPADMAPAELLSHYESEGTLLGG